MAEMLSRYAHSHAAKAAEGWSLTRLTPPSRLFGANGIRTGADGLIYIAQVPGSMISSINPDSGAITTISPMGGDIVGPDDLVFDEHGNLYVTELTENRISMRAPNGTVTVLQGDMPVANPITYHQGRLFAGECRPGGRIMELDRNGGPMRIIKEDVPMPNAFEIGADGKLYAPIMGMNEIWKIDVETGAHEVVAGDLGVPDAVKFDSKGRIVTTQVASGQVLRLDLVSGGRETLADLGPGLDNVTFVGDRIFISSIAGEITEILEPGKVRSVVPRALQWPMGLAVGPDGALFVSDGVYGYTLRAGESLQLAGMVFYPGCPGFMRGVAAGASAGEWIIATGLGSIARYRPAEAASDVIADGYAPLMGVDTTSGGAVAFAEFGAGRVHLADGGNVSLLAEGLDGPMGLAVGDDDAIYVTERGAGRVVRLRGGKAEALAEGFDTPEGLCFAGGALYALDVGAKTLSKIDVTNGAVTVVASDLPVGAPAGIVPKYLGPVGNLAGPMIPFADVTAGPDGTLYIAGDAEGSVLSLRPA